MCITSAVMGRLGGPFLLCPSAVHLRLLRTDNASRRTPCKPNNFRRSHLRTNLSVLMPAYLFEHDNQGFNHGTTCVVAFPGFGKSSLVDNFGITEYIIVYYSQFRPHTLNDGLAPNAAEHPYWDTQKSMAKMT